MQSKSIPGKEDPFEVGNKGGQTSILIYPRGRGGYVFRYYVGGKAKTVERVDRDEAIKEARAIAAAIDAGSAQAGKLTAADMESYVHAVALLPADAPPLHAVVGEWVAIRQAIGAAPVSELLAVWKRAGRRGAAAGDAKAARVQAISDAYLAELRVRAAHAGSTRNLEGFQADLPRFCEAFGDRAIAEIGVGEIADWLAKMGVGAKRHDNVRGEIVTLFRWARERGFLDEERRTEPEKVARLYKGGHDIEYWKPGEVARLFEHVSERWLPCLALAAFAGMRISEIGRLDWSAFDWANQRIFVRANVALKKRRSRRVPIMANLAAWLQPFRQEKGPLYEYKRFSLEWSKEAKRLEKRTKMPWRNNNLRHGYGSYQMALVDNYGQVAAWMGSSESMIKKNYDGLATPAEARLWQSIGSPPDNVVVPMAAGG